MQVHERISSRRKELGLTAEQVADTLGVSRSTIYRYESSDIEKLPANMIEPLSIVLQTTPAYLMGWEEEKPANKSELPQERQQFIDMVMKLDNRQFQMINDIVDSVLRERGE